MSSSALTTDALLSHATAWGLLAARLLPVTFLCPLLGARVLPTSVRLGLLLGLGLFVRFGAQISVPRVELAELPWAMAREAMLGTGLGLVAALPFEAARMGGRLIDTIRGASAEAILPHVGSREAATGDFLYQLLLVLALATGGLPRLLGALTQSFVQLPVLGAAALQPEPIVTRISEAFALGLKIGAPTAVAVLAVDATLAVTSVVAPRAAQRELVAPLRLLLGAVLLTVGLESVCEPILQAVDDGLAAIATLRDEGLVR